MLGGSMYTVQQWRHLQGSQGCARATLEFEGISMLTQLGPSGFAFSTSAMCFRTRVADAHNARILIR